MNDFRYALRTLRNSPGFAIAVTILLAIGIGANCVIFSALDAVMLKRLPVHHPEELFRIVTNRPQLGKRSDMSRADFQAFQERAASAAAVFGFQEQFAAVTEPGPAEQIRVHLVTPNYFSALGAPAAIGRVLAPDDVDRAVLSYGFYEQRFGVDGNVIGRSIMLHGHRFTVVGVMPREFNGISVDSAPQARVPLAALPQFSDSATPPGDEAFDLDVSMRLRSGVPVAKASGEINSIWQAVESKDTVEIVKGVELDPLEHGISRLRDRFAGALLFLTSAVGLLLLIVCANVAGLLLARSAGRKQEIAIRFALGSTRIRLVRQMLTETLLLAAVGGFGGIAIAMFALPLLEHALPPMRDFSSETVPLALHLVLNSRVLAFSLLLCLGTGVVFGLVPALQASRFDVQGVLRSTRSTSSWRSRQALMIFEVALCTVLLAGAGLLVRTFEQLQHLDTGFDRDHVVTFTVSPRLISYTPQQEDGVQKAWIEKVRALPGVTSVAVATLGVMRGSGMKTTMGAAGQRITSADFMNTSTNRVSPEYFETMGVHLVAGRGFVETDRTPDNFAQLPVDQRRLTPVIVNETFGKRFFPGESPIGKAAGSASQGVARAGMQVIGVVSDAKYRSLREPIPPTVYTYYRAVETDRFILHVRTANRPESIIAPVREALRSIDAQVPIVEIHTLAEEVSASLSSERLVAILATIFGAIAALLTAVGLYGLLAYALAQRTREIGIRIALGARPSDISQAIGGQALGMVACGLIAGVAATLLLAPLVRSLLYGIPANDGLTLFLTTTLILTIGAIATAIPIARALGIDPAIALRQE